VKFTAVLRRIRPVLTGVVLVGLAYGGIKVLRAGGEVSRPHREDERFRL
jgi:hypothetical protein